MLCVCSMGDLLPSAPTHNNNLWVVTIYLISFTMFACKLNQPTNPIVRKCCILD